MGMDSNINDSGSAQARVRLVTCPHCTGDSVYHPSNPARPFCSPRCKAMDLGAWANEDFRVAESGVRESIDLNDA